MIFVTVGTTDFDALVLEMDRLAPTLEEPVTMQVGRGKVHPRNAAEHFAFASSLEPYCRRASVVVSHGGLGTLVEVLRLRGRVVGVSNAERYDRHQEDLLAAFEAAGYLVWCRDLSHLREAIVTARGSHFTPYEPPPCTLHEEIAAILAEPAEASWWHRLTGASRKARPRCT